MAEASKGRHAAFRCFLLAFICDCGDVASHCIVLANALHTYLNWGFAIPHELVHPAEWAGIAAAVVSTVAAVCGELLASKPPTPAADHDRKGEQT